MPRFVRSVADGCHVVKFKGTKTVGKGAKKWEQWQFDVDGCTVTGMPRNESDMNRWVEALNPEMRPGQEYELDDLIGRMAHAKVVTKSGYQNVTELESLEKEEEEIYYKPAPKPPQKLAPAPIAQPAPKHDDDEEEEFDFSFDK